MNDQISALQSLLDHYRTRYYQTEYDFAVYQVQVKATIAKLEQELRDRTAATEESTEQPG